MIRLCRATCLCLLLAGCGGLRDSSGFSSTDEHMYQSAIMMEQSGNYESAAGLYTQLIQNSKTSVAAHLKLAALYRKLKRTDEAVQVMAAARSLQPANPKVLMQLGYALIDAGQQKEAVAVLDELIAIEPDNALAHNAKAVAFDSSGNHFAAQDIYHTALGITPGSTTIANNLGLSYIMSNQPREAIDVLEPTQKSDLNNKTLRQNLAMAYGIAGDKDKAMSLNLVDLPRDKAENNLHFYETYAAKLEKEYPKAEQVAPQPSVASAETPVTPPVDIIETKEPTPQVEYPGLKHR